MSEPSASLTADVRIARGFRPLTQHGTLVIADGVVTLLDSQHALIASGTLESVKAKRIGFPGHGLRLTVGGDVYVVDAASHRKLTVRGRRMSLPSLSIRRTLTLTTAVIDLTDEPDSSR